MQEAVQVLPAKERGVADMGLARFRAYRSDDEVDDWWDEDQTVFEYECPDRKNCVTLKLKMIKT